MFSPSLSFTFFQTMSRLRYTLTANSYDTKKQIAETASTMQKARSMWSFTGINRLVRSTSATMIPVDAMKDIMKTICDFSGSKR